MRNFNKFVLASVIAVCSVSTSKAELVYDVFLRVDGTDLLDEALRVDAGQRFTAQAVFRETATQGSTAILSTRPLGAVGLSLSTVGADGFFENPDADDIFIIPGAGDIGGAAFGGGLNATEVRDGVFEVVFGTVDLIAPTSSSTTFLLADAQPEDSRSNWGASGSGPQIMDRDIRFRDTTLTAIPEPTSLAFLAAMGGVLALRRRRRI
ncbi:MAG: PEP-CTERM sorting domain-containing protein [Planctomycetota bacterium]